MAIFPVWNSLNNPFFNSKIPSKIYDSPIGFEILRLARKGSDSLAFIMLLNK